MKYRVVELERFSGRQAKIYSIIPQGKNKTLFDNFIDKFKDSHKREIKNIMTTLHTIGNVTGARDSFFKLYEGKIGDGVCALYDYPKSKLRLYCLKFGMVAVILGDGELKPKSVKAWQDDPKLKLVAEQMIAYAADFNKRIDKDIFWSDDMTQFEGNLNQDEDEN